MPAGPQTCVNQMRAPPGKAPRQANRPLLHKLQGPLPRRFCPGPRRPESSWDLFKSCFSDPCGSGACKPGWFSKLNVFGAPLSAVGFKLAVPNVGFKPLAPQGEALGFEFLANCEFPVPRTGLMAIVSQPLLPDA